MGQAAKGAECLQISTLFGIAARAVYDTKAGTLQA